MSVRPKLVRFSAFIFATSCQSTRTSILTSCVCLRGKQGELSAEDVRSAVQGQSGVVAVGSAVVSPGSGGSTTSSEGQFVPRNFHTRGLSPQKRYAVVMCTEGNSGTLSDVVTAFAQTHAEAPLVSATEVSAKLLFLSCEIRSTHILARTLSRVCTV